MRSQTTNATIAQMAGLFLAIVLRDRTRFIKPKFCLTSYVYYACMFRLFIPGRRRRQKRRFSLKAFHSISDSTKLLPYIFAINTTIHPNNEIFSQNEEIVYFTAIPSISFLDDRWRLKYANFSFC